MKKRVISFLLVAVMAFGLGAPAYASNGDADTEVDTSDMTVEGTNDVGDLLAEELQEKSVSGAGGNHISSLTVEGSVATVELVTDQAGEVVVAVYDEGSGQMLASGTALAEAGTETVSVTIEGTVPQYFVATAFLLDAVGHEPLCEEYTTNLYTKEMQDFLDTDVNDYDADRVLNLDGDPSTNFMVYSASTIVVKENGLTNVLTDNGDGTYTVTNADEPFTSLAVGDTFSYEQNDGNVKLVKVASVSVDGTTVLITEDENVDMEDVFDYVKIEVGDGTDDDPSGVEAIAFEGEGSATVSTISVSYNNSGIKISGSLKTKLGVKVYLSWKWKYVELKATSTLSGSLEVTEKLPDTKVPIGSAGFTPVAGLYVGFEFNFVIKSNISVKSNFSLKKTYTLTWEDGTFQKDTSDPKIEFELNVEGSLFIGLSIEAHLNLLSDKILKLSVEVEIGGEIKAALAVYEPDKTSERHTCSNCVDGDINAKAEITCSVRVFNSDKWTAKATICSISIKIGDFYYSNDYDEFGWGTCPHISYQITMTVLDENEQPVSGALVDGTGLEEAPVTDEEGVAEFYLPNGIYEVTVSLNGKEVKETVEVKDIPREITVVLSSSIDPSEPEPTNSPGPDEDKIIASGDCGTNLKWVITEDGTITISGSGDMLAFPTTVRNPPWEDYKDNIQHIVIDEGVTSIGEHAFNNCINVKSVRLAESITEIGRFAFCRCSSLSSIQLPSSITQIKEHLFSQCSSLQSIIIPDGVDSIALNAFYQCSMLTSITIPSTVTVIGDHAFTDCNSLGHVYFGGSSDQWSAITIAGGNDCLTNAAIHYNSTGPENVLVMMGMTDTMEMEAGAESVPEPMDTLTPEASSEPGPTTEPSPEPTEGATPEPTGVPEPTSLPETTAEPTAMPEPTAEPTATPEPAEIAPQQASQEESDGVVMPVSAFDGTSEGQTALFTGLVPGADYAIVVALDLGAPRLLASSNLLYIAQVAADGSGNIALSYVPRDDSKANVRGFGPSCDHVWNDGEITVEATCTAHGEKTYTCTICGLKRTEPVAALGHAWDEGSVTKQPAEGVEGEKTYTCTRCGETRTEPIPALTPSATATPVPTDEPEATVGPEPTAAPTTKPASQPAGTGDSVPRTGDETPLALYAGLLALCLGALALCLTRRKTSRK